MLRIRKDPILVVQQGKKRGRAHTLIARANIQPIIQTDVVPRVFAAGQFIMADNLVPRVLGLLGQRVSARRDSGIIDLNYIFDSPLA